MRRRIRFLLRLWLGVTAHPTAEWIARQFNHPRSKPKRSSRRAAAYAEAVQEVREGASRNDHGQAQLLRRSAQGYGPAHGTPLAQRAEQSGGEFSSADAATRADHEAVQTRHGKSRNSCRYTIRSLIFSIFPIARKCLRLMVAPFATRPLRPGLGSRALSSPRESVDIRKNTSSRARSG